MEISINGFAPTNMEKMTKRDWAKAIIGAIIAVPVMYIIVVLTIIAVGK